MIVVIFALLLNSALLTGNEFAVAAFIHPSLSGKNHRSNLAAIQRFAQLYGQVMPLWMGITAALHLVVAVLAWVYSPSAFPWFCTAAVLWAVIIPYSLIFPVPLNNQIIAWDLADLPADWEAIRRQWDVYNWLRVGLLIAAFVSLSVGTKLYSP